MDSYSNPYYQPGFEDFLSDDYDDNHDYQPGFEDFLSDNYDDNHDYQPGFEDFLSDGYDDNHDYQPGFEDFLSDDYDDYQPGNEDILDNDICTGASVNMNMKGMLSEINKIGFSKSQKSQIPKSTSVALEDNSTFTNVYVKNFAQDLNDDKLRQMFADFGGITSAKVMCDEHGKSRGFGFVCFKEHEAAKKACRALNNSKLNDRTIYVGRALKKEEREKQKLYIQRKRNSRKSTH